ncbi:MAG: zinc metalloprotease HtpX [Candidatus Bathyarchaeia archaeon]
MVALDLWKLRLSMLGTLAVIIGISTLGFTTLLYVFGALNLFSLIILVASFNLLQWLIAPYLVEAMYRAKPADPVEHSNLYGMVERLSARSGISPPSLMIAEIPIPNAFAYGSPLTGSRVAVTRGLLRHLEPEEVEAVIGHEFGHIRHRDVQVMMFVSLLPSLFFILARYALYSSYYGDRRGDRRSGGLALASTISMFVYFILLLFTLGLSRLREYYADQHSVIVVEEGSRKLSEGLAKISMGTWRTMRQAGAPAFSGFKTLFISDPDRAAQDAASVSTYIKSDEALVREIMSRKVTGADQLLELFSTHPNIVKRIIALRGQM